MFVLVAFVYQVHTSYASKTELSNVENISDVITSGSHKKKAGKDLECH